MCINDNVTKSLFVSFYEISAQFDQYNNITWPNKVATLRKVWQNRQLSDKTRFICRTKLT